MPRVAKGRTVISGNSHMERQLQDGYTLLEMLIVLAIFSLVIGFAVPSLRSSSATMEVKQAEAVLVSAFREARAQAVSTNHRAAVTLDLAAKSLSFDTASPGDVEYLGEGLQIEMTTARALSAGESEAAILFFPDGTSSGGRVTLQSGGAVSTIEVDWMTGQTRVVAPDAGPGTGGRDG